MVITGKKRKKGLDRRIQRRENGLNREKQKIMEGAFARTKVLGSINRANGFGENSIDREAKRVCPTSR
jgi:hypothetical protein